MTEQELRQEIERTRRGLGEILDELSAKADMKARARSGAAEAKARALETVDRASERARRSRAVRRGWPWTAAAVLAAVSAAIRRRTR
jgi:hypothetical protein